MTRPRTRARARTRIRAALAVTTALLLTGSLVAPATAAPERRTPVVRVTSAPVSFSPDGDGVKDVARVTYRLARASRVVAIISSGDRFVLRRDLGRQGRGAHAFTWDGTRGGKVERDARYTITLLTGKGRARAALEVDNVWSGRTVGGLGFGTGSVFPRTTVIRDVALGGFSTTDDSGAEAPFAGSLAGLRLQAVSPTGRIVASDAVDTSACPDPAAPCSVPLTWDGRDDRGRPLPAGPYDLRVVRGRAASGAPITLTDPVRLTVSNIKLVQRTVSWTIPAAKALRGDGRYSTPPEASSCAPVPSARFPEGLTFGQPTGAGGFPCAAVDTFYVNVDYRFRRTPHDTYTVAASGGPTTRGGADSGTLSVVEGRPVTLRGERDSSSEPVATGWVSLDGDGPPRISTGPAIWTFRADPGASYDIDTFLVTTYQYGAPQ